MKKSHLNKAYVSPHDQFLFEFDKTHKPSASQLKEAKKHQRIASLRDHVSASKDHLTDESV